MPQSFSVGTDIIEIARVRDAIKRHGHRFLDRLFTAKEQKYCDKYKISERHYAGRFAAKEAISKALGTGLGKSLSFLDIEIINNADGKPITFIKGELNTEIAISISHCRDYATATAIFAKLVQD
ncbi:MAG: holo-ACP synthase [Chlamydiales bacterium]